MRKILFLTLTASIVYGCSTAPVADLSVYELKGDVKEVKDYQNGVLNKTCCFSKDGYFLDYTSIESQGKWENGKTRIFEYEESTTTCYYDKSGRLVKDYNDFEGAKNEYQYDDYDRLSLSIHGGDDVANSTYYLYDDEGSLEKKRVVYDYDGTIVYLYSGTENDSKGNWIRRMCNYSRYGENHTLIETREISYWDGTLSSQAKDNEESNNDWVLGEWYEVSNQDFSMILDIKQNNSATLKTKFNYGNPKWEESYYQYTISGDRLIITDYEGFNQNLSIEKRNNELVSVADGLRFSKQKPSWFSQQRNSNIRTNDAQPFIFSTESSVYTYLSSKRFSNGEREISVADAQVCIDGTPYTYSTTITVRRDGTAVLNGLTIYGTGITLNIDEKNHFIKDLNDGVVYRLR